MVGRIQCTLMTTRKPPVNAIATWFSAFVTFQKVSMKLPAKSGRSRFADYDEVKFNGSIAGNWIPEGEYWLKNDTSIVNCKYASDNEVSSFAFTLPADIISQHDDVYVFLDRFFCDIDGVVGFACSSEDNMWQNNDQVELYQMRSKSIDGVAVQSAPGSGRQVIDVEQFPGHSHYVNGLWFGSCWKMWFGSDYYHYVPREILAGYANCLSNTVIANEFRCITLYESPFKAELPENRFIQKTFRDAIGVDTISHALLGKAITSARDDAVLAIEEGNFSHGGVRLLKYFYRGSQPVKRSDADSVYIAELNKMGKILWEDNKKL